MLDDGDRKAFRAYHVHVIPSVFLIDAEEKVVRFLRGSHSYDSLKASLKVAGL